MPSKTQPFKNYERQNRVHYAEDVFGQGMNYTNAPLPPGFVQLLVNYDLKDGGSKLTPRPGLKTDEISIIYDDIETTF